MINFPAAYRKLYKHLETYSGSQFIKLIQKYDPAFPDFPFYLELRRKDGKSTIRKEYFKDILFSYPDILKMQLFEMFLKQYERVDLEEAKSIRFLLEER